VTTGLPLGVPAGCEPHLAIEAPGLGLEVANDNALPFSRDGQMRSRQRRIAKVESAFLIAAESVGLSFCGQRQRLPARGAFDDVDVRPLRGDGCIDEAERELEGPDVFACIQLQDRDGRTERDFVAQFKPPRHAQMERHEPDQRIAARQDDVVAALRLAKVDLALPDRNGHAEVHRDLLFGLLPAVHAQQQTRHGREPNALSPVGHLSILAADFLAGGDDVGLNRGPSFEYEVGDVIPAEGGDFEVVACLGAGGMGAVYDVVDKSLGRRCVVKKLHDSLADREDIQENFVAESRAIAQLDHPYIVRIYRISRTRDGRRMPLYAMERLPGESLRNAIKRKGKLPIQVALPIAEQMLRALSYVHERKLVHRDIKPDNIFLVMSEGEFHFVKLLDFGVMTLTHARTSRKTFAGTPRYAAPEQLLFNADGPAIDVYATALTLYETVAGAMPWGSGTNDFATCKERALVEPPPLSSWGNFPQDLEIELAIAMSPEPGKRHPSIGHFVNALARINNSLPPSAAPVTSPPSRDDGRLLPLPRTEFTQAAVAPATEPVGPSFEELHAMMGVVGTSPAATVEGKLPPSDVAITREAGYEALAPAGRKPSETTTPEPKQPAKTPATSAQVPYVPGDPESWKQVQATAAAIESVGAEARPGAQPWPSPRPPEVDRKALMKRVASDGAKARANKTEVEPPEYSDRIRRAHRAERELTAPKRSFRWHASRAMDRYGVVLLVLVAGLAMGLFAWVTMRTTAPSEHADPPAHSQVGVSSTAGRG